ncbi:MAG TPA: hypothetical protein VFE78_11310, partial [Gemmataceae bacterium]|nr:hypothetical protein [Gemmataceae bacterium]
TSDLANATAYADRPITIIEPAPAKAGGRECSRDEAPAMLGQSLDALPASVFEPRRVRLGVYRGLYFGVALYPQFAPEVYLEGAATRQSGPMQHRGPRAVLNALERLAGGYGPEIARVRQDLAIAEGQLRDYQARLGRPFAHEEYLAQLTTLRDQLKAGLAGVPAEEGREPMPVAELAERIKALKAGHSVEATPERSGNRPAAAGEEPVTTRIRRRAASAAPAAEPGAEAPEADDREVPGMTHQERLAMEGLRKEHEPGLC